MPNLSNIAATIRRPARLVAAALVLNALFHILISSIAPLKKPLSGLVEFAPTRILWLAVANDPERLMLFCSLPSTYMETPPPS